MSSTEPPSTEQPDRAPLTETTRDRLVAAAHAVIRDGGYGAATVAAVAERAGTGPSTLYRHYPSKAELFVEVFRTVCEGEILAAESAAAAQDDPVDQIYAWARTFSARALAAPRLAWALIAEPVDPLVEAERLAFRRNYRDGIAARIAAAVDAGRLPAQDPHLTAAALVGALGEALVGPTSPDADAPDPADLLEELVAFTRRALGDR